MLTLTADEAKRFLRAAQGDRLYPLYYLALHTGMREGELLALRWRDIDFERGTIHVVRLLKTRTARRQIELLPEDIDVLRRHRETMRREGHEQTHVFISATGTALNPPNFQARSFKPLLRAAKCPNVRFHDLRHTAATLLLAEGVHPKIVSERLGHATIAITMDLYQHVSPTMQREAAVALGRALGENQVVARRAYRGGQRGGQAGDNRPTPKTRKPAKHQV